ncbi:MAG TPA: HK97 family phage prohead protease [Ornithinicoccus sp.]|nr:HK97 family phage prohead protease [Ornithinicoccus sp.]
MQTQTKALRGVEIKDASQGKIQAVFATFDVIDRDGDVTRKSAFKDGAPVRISAYNHASWEGALPVGKGVIRVGPNEAILEGQFFMNTSHGRDAFETVKAMGELQEFSYGFHVTDAEPGEVEGKSVRIIKGVDVHEVSPVLLGAGIGTRTLAVKGQKRTFTQADRDAAAEAGHAMDDGSYPIENVQDLRNAIRAVGRGGKNHDEIRRHIMRQARRLNATNLIPDNWAKDGSLMDSDGKAAVIPAIKGAIPPHETDTVSRSWNAAATVKGLAEEARPSELRTVYAWVDPDADPEMKSSYAFPHHHGVDGPANLRACLQGIAVLNGATGDPGIPAEDREAVYKHLAAHLSDADRDVPDLREDPGEKGRKRFADEAVDVMAAVASFVDRAAEVVALRAQKGRGISPVTADLLSWLESDLVRLKSLLETPVEADQPAKPSDDEVASVVLAALARVNNI